MHKETWDALTDLIIHMDDVIAKAQLHDLTARRDGLTDIAAFNRGKVRAYQSVTKWARGRLATERKTEAANGYN